MTESTGIASEAHGQELPNGTRLQEFVIERTIGFGGFGITYLALDTSLGRKVVIKEHLPDMFSFRDVSSMTVRPRHSSGETLENYEWSMGSFTRESEMLAALEHPNIVRILRRFEANGTAYFVMPFVEGQSFDKVIESRQAMGGGFSESELREVLDPLLGAFSYLHSLGIYHRDVKPGNILVTSAGVPVLIDFGAARQQLGAKSMTVIESAGYTPFEQTESRGNVGPWSDLYALGGVLRKAITFETPARSADRIRRDPMVGLAGDPQWRDRFSGVFLEAVDRALRVNEEDRWQQAEDWLNDLRNCMVSANVGTPSEIQVGTQAASRAVTQPAPSLASQYVAPAPPPPAEQTVTPSDPSATQRKEMPRSAPLRQSAKAPVPQLATPVEHPVRKKKPSWALAAVSVLLCAGGAGFAIWHFQQQKQKQITVLASNPVVPLDSPPPEKKSNTKPVPVDRAPIPAQWEKLANEGNAFAQALLGEALITGTSGFKKDIDSGLQWLASAAVGKHPLGVFLDAEQKVLKKADLKMRSGVTMDTDKENVMFSEAFALGLEKDAPGGGTSWSAALGRAYNGGLGTAADPAKALSWLSIAGEAGHVESEYLLAEIYETGSGVRASQQTAAQWYGKAAEMGWPAAQVAMARLCANESSSFGDTKAAFNWASKAAASGSSNGMAILGRFYEVGKGVSSNAGEAMRLYGSAAENGDATAKGHLGRIYLEGKIQPRSEIRAFRLLQEAVDGGDMTSCFALGSLYESGKGGKKDLSEAINNYKAGAKIDDPAAQTALGVLTEQGTETGLTANPAAAARLYEEASTKGFPDAQFRLGMLLLNGKGVRKDPQKAAELLKKAAEQDLPSACFEWAKCLEMGTGTAVNKSGAIQQYEQAAKMGLAEAAFRAGLLSEEGRGTSKDEAAALRHYKTAADAGNASAQVNLGLMYAQGRGATKDDVQAVAWYRKAADQGDADGLVLLGMMCQFGQGTARSPQDAARYYSKAASQGDTDAKELLKKIKP